MKTLKEAYSEYLKRNENGLAVQSPQISMAILHNGETFEPCVEDGVQIEWDRHASAGKMTFTTMAVKSFSEGDPVAFYYNNKCIFKGYVFTKKRSKSLPKITVTAYDQLRYLKNKFSYVFVKKKASDIVKSLCEDFNLEVGTIEDSKYIVEAVAEENKSAVDIALSVTEETLANTGQMYVLYDDAGKICYRNVLNMKVNTVLDKDTAQDLDYQTSIDEETYNRVVLYYKPKSSTGSSSTFTSMDSSLDSDSATGSGAQKILSVAASQIGTAETGNNNVKYNTWYYGHAVSGSAYPWCAVFVSWVFQNAGMASLITKSASCEVIADGFRNRGSYVSGHSGLKAGDVVFYDWANGGGTFDHIGIVESISGANAIVIEGNYQNRVSRVTRSLATIKSYGRPAY